MGKREKEEMMEKRMEQIQSVMGYMVLYEDCLVLSKRHNVEFLIEETKGKTHLLHVAGSEKRISLFLDALHARSRDVPVKWITVPYKGVMGKWKLRQKRKTLL